MVIYSTSWAYNIRGVFECDSLDLIVEKRNAGKVFIPSIREVEKPVKRQIRHSKISRDDGAPSHRCGKSEAR